VLNIVMNKGKNNNNNNNKRNGVDLNEFTINLHMVCPNAY